MYLRVLKTNVFKPGIVGSKNQAGGKRAWIVEVIVGKTEEFSLQKEISPVPRKTHFLRCSKYLPTKLKEGLCQGRGEDRPRALSSHTPNAVETEDAPVSTSG